MNQDTQGLYRLKLVNRAHQLPVRRLRVKKRRTNPFKAPIKRKRPASGTTGDANVGWNDYYQNHNPCHPGYYRGYHDHRVEKYRNVLVSDLGMIAKLGQDNTLTVAITDVIGRAEIRH